MAIRAGALNQFLANPLDFTNVFTSLVDRKTKNAKHSINTAAIVVVVVAFIMTTFMMFLLLFAPFQFNAFNSCAVWCEWEVHDEEVDTIRRVWHFSSFLEWVRIRRKKYLQKPP